MSTKSGNRRAIGIALALAMGATVESAARQTGVTERTVYRWLKRASFRRKVTRLRDDMMQRSSGMLTASAIEACKTLLGLLATTNPPTVRLGAARAVLEIGIKVREVADLSERVAELEQRFGGPKLHAADR